MLQMEFKWPQFLCIFLSRIQLKHVEIYFFSVFQCITAQENIKKDNLYNSLNTFFRKSEEDKQLGNQLFWAATASIYHKMVYL